MTPLKNTSMVHFEDEMVNECDESRDTHVVPKKKTSGSQRGIFLITQRIMKISLMGSFQGRKKHH